MALRTLVLRVKEKIKSSPDFATLHDTVGAIFAKQLLTDKNALNLTKYFVDIIFAAKWSELSYERVLSVAMTNYVGHFVKHEHDRYVKFLENVTSGKKKVFASVLLPHMAAKEAVQEKGKPQGILAEAQWKCMVSDLKESGSKLSTSMTFCDVSSSMSATLMEVCPWVACGNKGS
ncbi:hypothetical protein L7F22_010644 [Adiantum nelumboides]|nr:hypothetical protein [Adiantum nelumboides]